MEKILDENGLPNFGLNQLTIVLAATLVATCRYFEGDIVCFELDKVSDESGSYPSDWLRDIRYQHALWPHILEYSQSITKFIESGFISATKTSRTLTGDIDPHDTYIDTDELIKWGDLTSTSFGGDTFSDYYDSEGEKYNELCLADWRFRIKGDNPAAFELRELSREALEARCEDMTTQYLAIISAAPAKVSNSGKSDLNSREKNTLLKIIAALDELLSKHENAEWTQKPYTAGDVLAAQMKAMRLINPTKKATIGKWIKEARALRNSN